MNLYKMIPKVDQILDNKVIKDLLDKNSKNLVMESIHEELDNIRNNISNGYDVYIDGEKVSVMLGRKIDEYKKKKDLYENRRMGVVI